MVSSRAGRTGRVDAVVTDHLDGTRSGVARFNELLARQLGVPLLGVGALTPERPACPLLSFKFSELDADERGILEAALRRPEWECELYLHEFSGSELERAVVARAGHVHCGNSEILERLEALTSSADVAWTPGLVLDDREFRPAEISVFSFGMAHKIRTDMFRRLRGLLDASGRSYAVYVSAANHETASLSDAEIVFAEMHEIFPSELYFLGNLSDVAVSNFLRSSTFFAAFFASGVRANNTSVASAMERGAVVVTNLDRHSPAEFVHGENVIDIERCDVLPSDPLELKRLSLRAMETGRGRSWERLAEWMGTGT